MTLLASSMHNLARTEEIRTRVRTVAPDRVPSIDTAISYLARTVALLTRKREENLTEYDRILIYEWQTRANAIIESLCGDVQ